MTDTTSIMDLPSDQLSGGNITMSASDKIPQNTMNGGNSASGPLDQGTISQLVNGLHQATIAGATQLPSRDIPMNTTSHNTDPQIHPNYVPPPQNNVDYIKDYDSPENMVNNYNNKMNVTNSLDEMYNEIQTPLLLSILYFLFQLPFFRRFLFSYFPILFANDGNYNLNGYLFCSVLFGLLFHLLNKLTNYFNMN
jgi:hypothetical protein